jgi:NhaA family Na+:H+ antiporter
LGPLSFTRDLRWWVNDGLMTLFFFVVGLEIRRELHAGELSTLRRAALPLAAALGGMIVPALIYAGFNAGLPTAGGWGVPMATDIAFAVGVLALLGKRVPPALRVLLLALAVIDDLGAIVIIALFYAKGFSLAGLGVGVAGLGLIGLLQLLGVRSPWAYVPAALLAWAGTYASGVHPTIAGVAVGLMTPVTAWWGRERLAQVTAEVGASLREGGDLHSAIATVEAGAQEALSPVDRLQHALHGWVAWGIMPLFALANAGVSLGSASLEGDGLRVFLGVSLGLVLGKALGVWGLARLAVATGLAAFPRGVGGRELSVVAAVAGIGFTMALFVAGLAFPPGPNLETAKLAILAASAVAGVVGLAVGRLLLPAAPSEGAVSAAAAEASTTD